MIRRYCLAIAGTFLITGIAVVVVGASPWTLSQFDGRFASSFLGHAVSEKLFGALLLLVGWVLIRFMAFGERMGLIQPPRSDVITLFDRDAASREPSAAPRDPPPK
jgi:hypothetical protein